MEPKILTVGTTLLLGMKQRTCLEKHDPVGLWSAFMPRKKEILHVLDPGLYSLQVYPDLESLSSFTPQTPFDKWAAVSVDDKEQVPPGMDVFSLPGGTYAQFIHKGPSHTFPHTAQFIFGQWLPTSDYEWAFPFHFERMLPDYLGPSHPEAEEEVWVPIRQIGPSH